MYNKLVFRSKKKSQAQSPQGFIDSSVSTKTYKEHELVIGKSNAGLKASESSILLGTAEKLKSVIDNRLNEPRKAHDLRLANTKAADVLITFTGGSRTAEVIGKIFKGNESIPDLVKGIASARITLDLAEKKSKSKSPPMLAVLRVNKKVKLDSFKRDLVTQIEKGKALIAELKKHNESTYKQLPNESELAQEAKQFEKLLKHSINLLDSLVIEQKNERHLINIKFESTQKLRECMQSLVLYTMR